MFLVLTGKKFSSLNDLWRKILIFILYFPFFHFPFSSFYSLFIYHCILKSIILTKLVHFLFYNIIIPLQMVWIFSFLFKFGCNRKFSFLSFSSFFFFLFSFCFFVYSRACRLNYYRNRLLVIVRWIWRKDKIWFG